MEVERDEVRESCERVGEGADQTLADENSVEERSIQLDIR